MLNLDLSQFNPVQYDSQFANVPLPSAHLVVIEESQLKESEKDGFSKGTNLLLELTILSSSCGNEYVGEKLAMYIPFSGFEQSTISIGMKRLSTLAYTLGIGGYLQNKEDLHGQNFIVVLEKQKNSNFANFKRILRADGQEIADASGNFKPCEFKENDNVLQVELEKLLAQVGGNVQQSPQMQAPAQAFGQPQQAQAQPQQVSQGATQPQSYTPHFGQQPQQVQQPVQNQSTPPVQPTPNFGQPQQATGFGGATPTVPAWGQTVNANNGQ